MTDILIRNYDHFWMRLDLDQLDQITVKKWEKICAKLLTLDVNMATQLRLRSWFPAAILMAEEAYEAAIQDEEREWIDPKGLRYAKLEQAKDNNRILRRHVIETGAKLKKLRTRYDIFKQKTNFKED